MAEKNPRQAEKGEPSASFLKTLETENRQNPSLFHDASKCTRCGRCAIQCQKIQGLSPMEFEEGSHRWKYCPTLSHGPNRAFCVYCGQCALACPTGAISEKSSLQEVKNAIADSSKFVIVQTAPAVRASLGETQGMPAGSLITGKVVAALRRLKFDKVLDTDFGADLTIMEEAQELVQRIEKNENLPLITSCCPAWVKYAEHFYPSLLNNISSCKSPHQMFGAIAKSYYAKKLGISPEEIIVVSIMPCTAKKFECLRPQMQNNGLRNVDYVLTTRELGKWLSEEKIELRSLPDEFYDDLLGASSGAGAIFGATGGVMEAALRAAAEKIEGKKIESVEYSQVRGEEGIREATVQLGGKTLNLAIAHGLKNSKKLLEDIKNKKSKYHFIEIMACPGGCVGGGGQPIPTNVQIVKKRKLALYHQDAILPLRKPQENPQIISLYKEFLGEPGSKKAHELLHTTYGERKSGRI
ncbi:ferredoxin [Candidatus Micrarchaeota archaeon CG10_big_fil_rev_8_21_14_0_10_45_29]|nr:MAG: ferredoxin [Candidatus Micrarchaeota archaeon CG10_big_fil_rev_8_21_14_0_10_45_29]